MQENNQFAFHTTITDQTSTKEIMKLDQETNTLRNMMLIIIGMVSSDSRTTLK